MATAISSTTDGSETMHAHIVHAHPEPASYNGALTRTACDALSDQGVSVSVSDLHEAGFDPVERGTHYADRLNPDTFVPLAEQRHAFREGTLAPEISSEIAALERADLLILQFPLWWHGPPAILKGWMDRVFVNGCLYTSRMRYDRGYFRGRRAIVSMTTGAPHEAFGPGGRGGDICTMLWPIHYSLHYLGFAVLPPFLSHGIQGHGYRYAENDALHAMLTNNLQKWRARLQGLDADAPLDFPGWDDWGALGEAVR